MICDFRRIADIGAPGWLPLSVGEGATACCSVMTAIGDAGFHPDGELPLATAVQIHSVNVSVADAPGTMPDTDALITFTPRLAIAVRTADCVPVLLHAPDIGAVAAVHAGWRGTLGNIVARTVGALVAGGADVREMYAAIGPCICGDCYEVSPELAMGFSDAGWDACIVSRGVARPHIDLKGVNMAQLISCGLDVSHIVHSPYCTLCGPDGMFPSYRRDATDARLYTVIWLDD